MTNFMKHVLISVSLQEGDISNYKITIILSAPLATVITLPPLYTCQSRLLLSNPHCRTASPPSTTHTEVGFDSSVVQWTLPTC